MLHWCQCTYEVVKVLTSTHNYTNNCIIIIHVNGLEKAIRSLLVFNIICIKCFNRTGCVMVSVLSSSAVDRGFEPRSAQIMVYKIGICFFSAMYAALRRMSKDWSTRNQDNVSEWDDVSVRGQLLQ